MADAYTGSSTLDFSKAAYDRMAYFALRPELYFDAAFDNVLNFIRAEPTNIVNPDALKVIR